MFLLCAFSLFAYARKKLLFRIEFPLNFVHRIFKTYEWKQRKKNLLIKCKSNNEFHFKLNYGTKWMVLLKQIIYYICWFLAVHYSCHICKLAMNREQSRHGLFPPSPASTFALHFRCPHSKICVFIYTHNIFAKCIYQFSSCSAWAGLHWERK